MAGPLDYNSLIHHTTIKTKIMVTSQNGRQLTYTLWHSNKEQQKTFHLHIRHAMVS